MRPWPTPEVTPCAICDQLIPDEDLEPWDTGDGMLLVCVGCWLDLEGGWQQIGDGVPDAPP